MKIDTGKFLRLVVGHAVFLAIMLGAWELAAKRGLFDPAFVGQPSGIFAFLWEELFVTAKVWSDLGWTLAGTGIAFALGSLAAVGVGLLFVSFPRFEAFMEPYLTAFNVMPRIALAPLFILWFGFGLGSKIAVGFSLTFFIVLSSTVAGIRGVSQDHVTLTRTLGAPPMRMFFMVTLPSAVPVIFSGLRLGLIYALLGVIGAEIIASEHGLGQRLAYLSSTFNVNGVMALLFVLSILGVAITFAMNALEKRLLRWQ